MNAEKRLDQRLEGLFMVTLFGLGLILGGLAVLQYLQIGSGFMIAYMVLSSAAFLVNIWLNVRDVFRITRSSREAKDAERLEQLSRGELGPMNAQAVLDAAPSVTENTTRELESISKESIRL